MKYQLFLWKILFLSMFFIVVFVCCNNNDSTQSKPIIKEEDKSPQIASFIQKKVNTGGYNGCRARSIGYQCVQVDLYFSAGTSRFTVETNVRGIADLFAQSVRFASTIYYTGYSGKQKICQYCYDPLLSKVNKVE